ncbi:MAG: TraR/DksA C4-type zinc finger protein [Actinomycetota bacterium]|nr:TraR/DksA C4-type zinc finger protein [Actinomycetota bacterium]
MSAPGTDKPAKKTTTRKPAGKAGATEARAEKLVVREDESPWTREELAHVHDQLETDRARVRADVVATEQGIADMLRDADRAGSDQADIGSASLERDAEMSLASNARDMLVQIEHALARIEYGTYGVCESCGNPVGKQRLMVFPRATLCMTCKQREERR